MKSEQDGYLDEKGRYVFTEAYHIRRGSCCGNVCKNCPFTPRAQKGTTTLKNK